ncbi:ABC transporter permease [Haloechinothrix sp. LS1_15]|uniref:ABC transporter permease n=1 Tax=Haloechinothrix sp. LS1_15 TaxID=2652248 RepID=UPI00294620A6|nr:ABC transporter permease [Haloechinothrix sp. LS1_15]MDV6014357.1 ABC transporter permease [Haloechinothrix sp. LS1_15]
MTRSDVTAQVGQDSQGERRAQAAAAPLPGALAIGLRRGVVELKQFFRQAEFVVFTFSLPAIILILLGSTFGDTDPAAGVNVSQILTASMIAAGFISTSFISMGVGVALDRQAGTLKRLRGTPMPATSYFIGKAVLVAVASVAQVTLLLVVGTVLFDLTLPTEPAQWLTFTWVFLLGIGSCTLLGIAASAIARGANAAAAATNLIYLTLNFTSGVFITISALPDAMVTASSIFPVKWIAQGMRSVFLPEEAAAAELAGQWELGTAALVIGAWLLVGLLLARWTFRWTNEPG